MSPAIIILAAGSSSRLGRSKQLLTYQGVSLLKRTAHAALETKLPVFIVLGANAQAHQNDINELPLRITVNQEWSKGMGHSLKHGLRYVLQQMPDIDSVLVLVCDQPHIDSAHLLALKSKFEEGAASIIASAYAEGAGVPALFGREWFDQILQLPDDQGARSLISKNKSRVATVPFPLGAVDIDTEDDVTKFLTD
ncbi:MAG: nucleotidyltransferase family protein [Cyclobacteriaceae bacterium]|nr:nucleotidyltransferase family protein [Cyclobacteriaceae bacterium]